MQRPLKGPRWHGALHVLPRAFIEAMRQGNLAGRVEAADRSRGRELEGGEALAEEELAAARPRAAEAHGEVRACR